MYSLTEEIKMNEEFIQECFNGKHTQTLVYTINTKTGHKRRTVVLHGDQCDRIRKQPSWSYGDGVTKYRYQPRQKEPMVERCTI
jgi:hypothetical protein